VINRFIVTELHDGQSVISVLMLLRLNLLELVEHKSHEVRIHHFYLSRWC